MTTKSLLVALGVGLAAAILYGVAAGMMGAEFMVVSIGVGMVVGMYAGMAGGKGTANCVACAIITLASIFTGKLLAGKLLMPEVADRIVTAKFGNRLSEAQHSRIVTQIIAGTTTADLMSAVWRIDGLDVVFIALSVAAAAKLGMDGNPIGQQTGAAGAPNKP